MAARPDAGVTRSGMAINYNEPITFGTSGNAAGLNCTGIDFSDVGDRSWTCAPVAELDVQLPFARQDILIELIASPFLVPGVLSVQNVFIYLGGLFVGYFNLKGHMVRSFPVNRNAVSGRATRLAIVIPTATSPETLGLSQDLRELGIYLTSITFKTTP
jgi:hypothetical protein